MSNTIIKAKQNALRKPIYDINLRHLTDPELVPVDGKLVTEAEKLKVLLSFARFRDFIEEELQIVVVVETLEGPEEFPVKVLKYQ